MKPLETGKKLYYQLDINKRRYTINFHNGVEKHKDGSDFYDMRIFKNKKDLEKFKMELHNKGYKYRGIIMNNSKPRKKILVNFTCITGEYEFDKHKVIEVNKQTEEDSVHDYFKNFYDCPSGTEGKTERYFFDNGCVAINIDGWSDISEEDAKVLSRLGL